MRNFLENVEILNMKLTFHHTKEKEKSTYSKNLLNEKKIHHEFWKTVKNNYLVKSGNSGHAKNFNIDEKSLTILQKCQMVLLAIIPQL